MLDEAIVKKITKARSKLKVFFDKLEYTVFGQIDTNKEFNTTDIFDKQEGQGLEILTPQQMLTRLPILLAQLQAGNNLQKLKGHNCCIHCIDQKS